MAQFYSLTYTHSLQLQFPSVPKAIQIRNSRQADNCHSLKRSTQVSRPLSIRNLLSGWTTLYC